MGVGVRGWDWVQSTDAGLILLLWWPAATHRLVSSACNWLFSTCSKQQLSPAAFQSCSELLSEVHLLTRCCCSMFYYSLEQQQRDRTRSRRTGRRTSSGDGPVHRRRGAPRRLGLAPAQVGGRDSGHSPLATRFAAAVWPLLQCNCCAGTAAPQQHTNGWRWPQQHTNGGRLGGRCVHCPSPAPDLSGGRGVRRGGGRGGRRQRWLVPRTYCLRVHKRRWRRRLAQQQWARLAPGLGGPAAGACR